MSKTIHIHLTPALLDYVNALVEKGEYTSVAEALRSGLRLVLKDYATPLSGASGNSVEAP